MSMDRFKDDFKHFKQRNQSPNFSNVLDVENATGKDEITKLIFDDRPTLKGLQPVKAWKAYTLDACPGFIIIQNPFEEGCQRYWLDQSIKVYPQSPNVTNIDSLLSTVPGHDVWEYSKGHHSDDITGKQSLIMKLRWVTLGYHYDWNNKVYHPDRYSKFPEDLSELCKYIASILGYETFSPEAGIVNYYHMDSTLAGHTDHSELDHDAPLISISFGQDAIFLIGGLTKETKPTAVMLHSGDICVMTGQSRLVYHAVPRIMKSNRINKLFFTEDRSKEMKSCDVTVGINDDPRLVDKNTNDISLHESTVAKKADIQNTDSQFFHKCVGGKGNHELDTNYDYTGDHSVKLTEDEKLFREYLNCTRINLNIRQVLKPNQKFPECESVHSNSDNKKLKLDFTC